MTGLNGLFLFLGSIVWLVTLLASGFSVLVVSVGLLTAMYLLGSTDA